MIPKFNSRKEYDAYMKKIRERYKKSLHKTTNGEPFSLEDIRAFQKRHKISWESTNK